MIMLSNELGDLAKTLLGVRICTSSLRGAIDSLQRTAGESIQAHEVLTRLGLLNLVTIATGVKTWKYEELKVVLDIPWNYQTLARRLYGGCFPEQVKRDVVLEDTSCDNPLVFRRYYFTNDNAIVFVRFYRETFDGDEVDGCKVELVKSQVLPDFRSFHERRSSYLSISCPVNRRKGTTR